MGTNDFAARKAAKKHRKKAARQADAGRRSGKRKRSSSDFDNAAAIADADDGLAAPASAEQLKRKRKRGANVSLRISRALCYAPPTLTPEDLAWDGQPDDGEQWPAERGVVRRRVVAGDEDGLCFEAGYDSDVEEAAQKTTQQQQQSKQPPQQQQPFRFSTAVNLLAPAALASKKDKQPKKQQQQQPPQQQRQGREQQMQQLDAAVAAMPCLQALQASGLSPLLLRCMAKLGFAEPTPIQAACWGPACAGRDVLGHAEPGSGKTLAYLLPVLARLAAGSGSSASAAAAGAAVVQPAALILLPSRELAQQVHGQATALFAVSAVSSAIVFGGVPREQQVAVLQQRQPRLLVATPGRLLDLIDAGVLSLSCTSLVVLDEADKMLSVGFEPQLQRLQAMLLHSRDGEQPAAAAAAKAGGGGSKKKQQQAAATTPRGKPQVLLFSATLPRTVQHTARAWLAPGCASVSCSAGADSISQTVTQVVQVCAEHKKPAKLLKHLAAIKAAAEGQRNPPRVLVFANRIKAVTFLHRTLAEAGYRAVMLHGKRSQAERQAAVADFKAGKVQVLVASDVASRGLDIRGLPYVVNYDFPSNLETYIHRVGRTGRLAAAGHAFSFFTRPLARLAGPLIDLLQAHEQPIDPNLLALSQAWAQAEAALRAQGRSADELAAAAAGPDSGDVDEEEEEAEDDEAAAAGGGGSGISPEDLAEGLPGTQQQQRSKAHAQQQQQQRQSKQAGDAILVPRQSSKAAPAAAAAATVGAQPPPPAAAAFQPSPRFAGARPGFAFKRGPQGVGYYYDAVQQQQQQQPGSRAGAPSNKAAAKQQAQALKRILQQQQQQQQPSGRKGGAAAASPAGGGAAPSAARGGSRRAGSSLPLLPGLAAKRRQLPSGATSSDDDEEGDAAAARGGGAGRFAANGGSSSSTDSDSDGGRGGGGLRQRMQHGQAAGSGAKRKALPGRLRKKLAKQKGGGGGGGGGGGRRASQGRGGSSRGRGGGGRPQH